jgi:hypothetical protein
MIASLDTAKTKPFNALCHYQDSIGLNKRLDSIPYAYAFVETHFLHEHMYTIEYYFNSHDSLLVMYWNGMKGLSFNRETRSLLVNLKRLRGEKETISTAPYKKMQVYFHGCIRPSRRQAKQIIKDRIAHSQKMLTCVDRDKNQAKVSLVLAPKHPRVFILAVKGTGF